MKPHELLNTDELSELLGVTRWTIYQWTKKELIPFYRTQAGHRKLLFSKDAVLRALKKEKHNEKSN